MKWVLHDPVAGDSWTMLRNPFEMATPVVPNRTQPMAGGLAFRKAPLPSPWQFKGRVKTQDEYDILLGWASRPNAIEITDHLGRIHVVVPTQFDPVPRRSRHTVAWRFDYTFKGLYLRRGTP